jgi:D-alanine transaminase
LSIAFINGEFVDVNQRVLPIDERGHQFGDGVYEVVKVYHSTPFLLNEHLQRLQNSAENIQIKLPYSLQEIEAIILQGIEKSGLADAEVYFQITRGIAPRNHLFPDVPPSFTMTIKPSRVVPQKSYEEGVSTILVEDDRWAKCYIKSLNLLPNILAKQLAASNGHFEAIMVKDGYVTEGTSSNVFAVKAGCLYTTPLTSNILPGITRAAILKLAEKKGIPFVEENFTSTFLLEADEVFMTSTSVEVLPVRLVDGNLIGTGNPGEVTKTIHEALKELYRVKV